MSAPSARGNVALDETLADSQGGGVSRVESIRPPGNDPLLGTRLHHFRVLRALGSGGMGAVYVALDESLEREVALKVLHPEFATQPALRERFVREARAQARLHCPNVVHLYYIGQEDEQLFFAMELVRGVALDKVIEQRGKPLSVDEALDAMHGVAMALREAHANGFIHRDIKPGNLLRADDGTIKLADFGLARPVTADSKITQSGMVIGSPAYMSPEQALGGDVDHRSDMYSLGAAFFHLLTGRPPYEGPTPIATITKHVTEPPPGPDAFGEAPPQVVRLLQRMLAKKPDDRFATYDDLLAAIDAARPRAVTYAGVPTRAAVSVVDQVSFAVLVALLKAWAIPLFALYITAAIAWRGQTLGDRFFRVVVTREDGGRVAPWQALLRHVVCHWLGAVIGIEYFAINGWTGLTGYLHESARIVRTDSMTHPAFLVGAALVWNGVFVALYAMGMAAAVIDKRKRTLHDRVAGTVVTYQL
jgi:uncharacterized RDD family membrane protein YckC